MGTGSRRDSIRDMERDSARFKHSVPGLLYCFIGTDHRQSMGQSPARTGGQVRCPTKNTKRKELTL